MSLARKLTANCKGNFRFSCGPKRAGRDRKMCCNRASAGARRSARKRRGARRRQTKLTVCARAQPRRAARRNARYPKRRKSRRPEPNRSRNRRAPPRISRRLARDAQRAPQRAPQRLRRDNARRTRAKRRRMAHRGNSKRAPERAKRKARRRLKMPSSSRFAAISLWFSFDNYGIPRYPIITFSGVASSADDVAQTMSWCGGSYPERALE